MFGIGFGELILLLVIALIVFGPEKLPEVAKTLGRFYRQIMDYSDSLRETFEKELKLEEFKEITNVHKEVLQPVLPEREGEKKGKGVIKGIQQKKLSEQNPVLKETDIKEKEKEESSGNNE